MMARLRPIRAAAGAAVMALVLGSCAWTQVASRTATAQSDGSSSWGDLSGDGRYVAFDSQASNLSPSDTNSQPDVFVRDNATGTVELVSVSISGTSGNGVSVNARISANGRYVVFNSTASDLVPNDNNGLVDVFLRDRQLGTTERISLGTPDLEANGRSGFPDVSDDGRYVVFESDATNLDLNDANGKRDIFLRDRQTFTTTLVSVSTGGTQGDTDADYWSSISADGRYIAFSTPSGKLVSGDGNATYDVFVRSRLAATTTRVSVGPGGVDADGASSDPQLSANGRYIAYTSDATNIVANDINGKTDVFEKDSDLGSVAIVSVATGGAQGNGPSYAPSINADGRWVSFATQATNLYAGDTNNHIDSAVRDTVRGLTSRVGSAPTGGQPDGDTWPDSLSDDGRYVSLQTDATNLLTSDTNAQRDVYVRAVVTPSISSVVPGSVVHSTTANVTINGTGFIVVPIVYVTDGNAAAIVNNVTRVSDTQLQVNVTLPAAPIGAWDVTVVIPGTGPGVFTGSLAPCVGCLSVT